MIRQELRRTASQLSKTHPVLMRQEIDKDGVWDMMYDFFCTEGCSSFEYDFWMSLGMKSVALFYLDKNMSLTERAGKVLYESMKTMKPFEVEKGLPSRLACSAAIAGDEGADRGLCVDGKGQLWLDAEKFSRLKETFRDDPVKSGILERAEQDAGVPKELYPARYWHCGTHKVADIEGILSQGYDGYLKRIDRQMERADAAQRSFLRGLRYTAVAMTEYFERCSSFFLEEYIRTGEREYRTLGEIMSRTPKKPCGSFREAIIVLRLLNLFCDSEYGRIDQYLYPYYVQDLERRVLTREEAKGLLKDMYAFLDRDGLIWHQVIGGCGRDGRASYNDLTLLVLETLEGCAHPHTSLRIRDDMPEEIWLAAMKAMGSGSGNPALVQEEIFIKDLVETYQIPVEDARDFAFGGCSEILIPGKTNVDSTWCAYNTAEILHETIYRELEACESYEEFIARFKEQTAMTVDEMVRHVNIRQHLAGTFLADPVMSLHTVGCVEQGKGYWEGGALYNFDGADIFGNTNVINSLVTIKALFDGRLKVEKQRLLKALKEDYANDAELLREISKLPKFGNGDRETGKIAEEMTRWLFECMIGKRIWRGNGYFIPDIIQWTTYATLGEKMAATADGRKAKRALADSSSAMAGTDEKGPTVVLGDCALLPHDHGAGTMVLNLSLAPFCFEEENIRKMPALFKGYFMMGGSQVQVTVADAKKIQAAFDHPEEHKDLIVRIGGFTDYFYKQSREIQRVVLERTIYGF